GARRAALVAEVEMIRARIVEVDGQLHQPQAHHLGIEVERPLRVAGDRRDVVDAGYSIGRHRSVLLLIRVAHTAATSGISTTCSATNQACSSLVRITLLTSRSLVPSSPAAAARRAIARASCRMI